MKPITAAAGIAAGLINGFFGTGGGMLLVPALRQTVKDKGNPQAQAQGTAVFAVLFLSMISAAVCLLNGASVMSALPYAIGGVAGAPVGARLLKATDAKMLKKLFGAFLLFAGLRLIFG